MALQLPVCHLQIRQFNFLRRSGSSRAFVQSDSTTKKLLLVAMFGTFIQEGPIKFEILILSTTLMIFGTLTNGTGKPGVLNYTNPYKKIVRPIVRIVPDQERLMQLAALQRMWTDIRVARYRMQKQKDSLKNFYKSVISHKGFTYEWLPEEHLLHFETKVRHLDKHSKVNTMIPKLYNSLKIFLLVLRKMLSFDETDQHVSQPSTYGSRRIILEQIADDLNSTMEEVKSAVKIFRLCKKINISTVDTEEKIEKHWDTGQSYTHLMVHDWGIITIYYKFVKDWEKIIKSIYENYCNTYKVTHQCRKSLSMADSIT